MPGTTLLMSEMPPTGWSFFLAVSDEVAGERGQQIRVKQLGPDLWSARFESDQMLGDKVRSLKAIVHQIMQQRTTFLAWDPRGQYPIADPRGLRLTTPATVQINSINDDNQRMSLRGLPAGYVLTRGDYLSFVYGASSARALHQIVPTTTTVVAGATGITPEFWVSPRIRVGASVTTPVTLIKPTAEMMILPGSLVASEGPRFGSLAFAALQVLP